MAQDRAAHIKQHLPAPVVSLARPIVRGAVYGLHRTRQTVRAGRRAVQLWKKELFLRYRLTPWGARMFAMLGQARAPRDAWRRRAMARSVAANDTAVRMAQSKGYVLLDPAQLTGLDQVLQTCRGLFDAKVAALEPVNGRDVERKRGFLRNILTNDDLKAHPELVSFALSDQLLGAVSAYLGTIPHLNRVDLLYSVPRAGDTLEASQLFHLDPEGLTQAKVFINIFDVGDAEGPFTFIPADESQRLVQEISARRTRAGVPVVGRYGDDEIAELGGAPAIVSVRGAAGSGVLVDTCRCLHCGSRVRPGSFRLCLYIQYCTSREQGNVFDVRSFANDPVRFKAVEQSRHSVGARIAAPHQMQ